MRKAAPRIAVRPTARGWQALVVGILVLGVAIAVGTTQFFQLAYLLIALVIAALLLGLFNSRNLGFSRKVSSGARITVGQPARVVLSLSGGSFFGGSRVEVKDRLPDLRSFEVSAPEEGKDGEIEVSVTFARRGIYELGPAAVRVEDPFGMLRFTKEFEERTEVLVYPEIHELSGFPLRGSSARSVNQGAFGRQGDEFSGIREYRRGDDRRHIHWKSLARTGELYVKEFARHAPKRYTVALDMRRQGLRAPEREVEDAVSAAASMLNHLAEERLPCRLMCNDRRGVATEFAGDEGDYWEAMKALATVKADGDRALGEAVYDERKSLGDVVIMVSRSRDEELPETIGKLRGAGLTVIVVTLASYTYRRSGVSNRDHEAKFLEEVGRLEAAGATVLVMRHPEGVAGLAEAGLKGTG